MLKRDFDNIIMAAADTAYQLRPQDVYRVVNEAHEQGKMLPFVNTLYAARPDLKNQITEAMQEIAA